MKSIASVLLFSLAVTAGSAAQELNDAGASLTSHGANPGFFPFFTSAVGSMALEVGGASNASFALILGERATTSFCHPLLSGECFDLEMGVSTIPLFLVVDGFAGNPFGRLDATGEAELALPATLFNNLDPAFQALVADATNPPLNLSFSAACEYEVRNTAVFRGDDNFIEYHFPSGGPYQLYGQSFSSMTVSTNGWIKLGGGCTFSDLSESTTDLFNGTIGGAPGGAPVIAPFWNDIDMGNSPNQEVRIREITTSSGPEVVVTWLNADLFPATPIGTFEVTLKSSGVVEIDHTGVNTILSGIVGLSSGENAGGTTITSHSFYNGGFPPNSFFSTSFRNTIYRNYNTSGSASPASIYTLCFQPANAFGAYDMVGVVIAQSCF